MKKEIDFVIKRINPELFDKERQGNPISMADVERAVSLLVDSLAITTFDYFSDLEELKRRVAARIAYDREVTVAPAKILEDKKSTPWLKSRLESGDIKLKNWDLYKKEISYLNSGSFVELDDSTDLILDKLGNPKEEGPWNRRGLVIGSVQSGKTANYLGLLNKASDAGYKVIIILSGIHNLLRQQTQDRVQKGFGGKETYGASYTQVGKLVGVGCNREEGETFPAGFTTMENDFNKMGGLISIDQIKSPIFLVIKKNITVLRHLRDWLGAQCGLSRPIEFTALEDHKRIKAPLLLIDDEADNASINTRRNNDEITAINNAIRETLTFFSRRAYVGYTATPFANIFIEPEDEEYKSEKFLDDDLFPANFITQLKPPSDYQGPNNFFGEEGPDYLIELIDNSEKKMMDLQRMIPAKHKKDYEVALLSDSLKEAIRTFIIVKSIRILRKQTQENHSMLINITYFKYPQNVLKILVNQYTKQLQDACSNFADLEKEIALRDPHIRDIHETFKKMFIEKDMEFEEEFSDILPHLRAGSVVEVLAINGDSNDSLNYDEYEYPNGRTLIAIGGHSLARGFTLQGLSVSYIARNTSTSDTLLQMARWFGYRPFYQDLCRVFITQDSAKYYNQIATTINELNYEIGEMQRLNKTPMEFGLKVREHPGGLRVTARNKIGTGRSMTRSISYWGKLVQKGELFKDESKNKENIQVAESFINNLSSTESRLREDWDLNRGPFWKGVSNSLIGKFIDDFQAPADETYFSRRYLVSGFISKLDDIFRNDWDVWVFSNKTTGNKKQLAGYSIKTSTRRKEVSFTSDAIRFLRSNIGSKEQEKYLLTEQVAKQAEDEFWIDPENEGKKEVNRLAYRKKLKNPALIIHCMDLFEEKSAPTHSPFTLTYSIHFPFPKEGGNEEDIKISYLYNEIAQEMIKQPNEIADEEREDE